MLTPSSVPFRSQLIDAPHGIKHCNRQASGISVATRTAGAFFVNTSRSILVASVVALVTLCALFSLSAHSAENPATTTAARAEREAAPTSDADGDEARGSVDLYGNAVTDAVARYSFDATGTPYEVHSPQTEIPKLGSPKS